MKTVTGRHQPVYFSRVLVRERFTHTALFGYYLADLFEVLVSRKLLIKWMGEESGVQGILLTWLVGLLMPSGPYVIFPVGTPRSSKKG